MTNRRAAQAGWLLFALLALSLALPGLEPYRQSLAMVCNGDDCLPGQLTPAEMAVVTQSTDPPCPNTSSTSLSYLIVFAFCLLSAGLFIWRLPTNGAAVAGAFVLTAMATGTLAAATAQVYPALRPAADLILFVQLAVLLPFLVTIPDGRFHPAWLRWAMLAAVPVAALVVFGVLEPPLSYILSAAIGVFTVGCVFYRYYLGRARPQKRAGDLGADGCRPAAGGSMDGRAVDVAAHPQAALRHHAVEASTRSSVCWCWWPPWPAWPWPCWATSCSRSRSSSTAPWSTPC